MPAPGASPHREMFECTHKRFGVFWKKSDRSCACALLRYLDSDWRTRRAPFRSERWSTISVEVVGGTEIVPFDEMKGKATVQRI